MHVAYLLSRSEAGMPHYTAALANSVSRSGLEVSVFKPTETSADEMFDDEVSLHEVFSPSALSHVSLNKHGLQPGKNLKAVLSYQKVDAIREVDPDVIHVTDNLLPHVQFFLRLRSLDRSYPIVVTHHHVEDEGTAGLSEDEPLLSVAAVKIEELLKSVLPDIRTSRYIVHTKRSKEVLERRIDTPVSQVPHGTYDTFSEYPSDATEEPNTVLLFGRLVPSKGYDTLIRAAPYLSEYDLPSLKIVIAGDGDIPPELREILDDYDKLFEVRNTYIPNEKVADLYNRATLVTIPQKTQGGHSGTLTIAYSFGKPVVTTDVGEFPEFVEQSGCGLTVPPGNPARLAEAIHEILSDDARRKLMSEASAEMAEKLSWSNVASLHVDIYRELL